MTQTMFFILETMFVIKADSR